MPSDETAIPRPSKPSVAESSTAQAVSKRPCSALLPTKPLIKRKHGGEPRGEGRGWEDFCGRKGATSFIIAGQIALGGVEFKLEK